MTTYNYTIGEKIYEWLDNHSTCGSWNEGWSSRILMYIGKTSVVLEWQEYGLDPRGQALWDIGYDNFEDQDTSRHGGSWDDFMSECYSTSYTDYNKVVGRSFLRVDRELWDAFLKDYDEVHGEFDLTWEELSLRKLPRKKMTYKNTTTIGELV